MLQVARLAPIALGEATENVRSFIRSRIHDSGGFVGRDDRPDLYYSVFGLDCMVALSEGIPDDLFRDFLDRQGDERPQGLIDLSSLARCWSAIRPRGVPAPIACPLENSLLSLRGSDGGFRASLDDAKSSIYATFLAAGALQDLGRPVPDTGAIIDFVQTCVTADGGIGNDEDAPIPMTPITSAGITLIRHFGGTVDRKTIDWLLGCAHPDGGFLAGPDTPIPDLLSTATALHALAGEDVSLEKLRELCLDYVDTLWTKQGSFFGHWADTHLDCEYTFYGLLALGHLQP